MKCEAINFQNQDKYIFDFRDINIMQTSQSKYDLLTTCRPCVISLSQYRVFEGDKAAQRRSVQAHYAH